ncbi:augmin complex subunit msd1 [Drosophila miranda]|uniref:augmin complex subunit msd1 n=1 Tax=Drosophila miranda TaxID=7229 RepID=UPI0007E796B3|nr:augmin complex subunit msd1 [Drosophila miranda]
MQHSGDTKQKQFEMPDAVDELLAGLVSNRQTMQRQAATIDEIMEKSNNTLIHIESQNKALAPTTVTPGAQKLVKVKPVCKQALVKILENFKLLMQQNSDKRDDKHSASDGVLACRQRVEHLASSVRKLVALCDTVHQLKTHQEVLDAEDEDLP